MKTLQFNKQTKDYFIERIHFTPEMLFSEKNLPLRPNTIINLNELIDLKIKNLHLDKLWLRVDSEFESFVIEDRNIDFTTDGRLAILIYSKTNKEEIEFVILLNLSHYHKENKTSLYVYGVYKVYNEKEIPLPVKVEETDGVLDKEQSESLVKEIKKFTSSLKTKETPPVFKETIPKTVTHLVNHPKLNMFRRNEVEVVGFTLDFSFDVQKSELKTITPGNVESLEKETTASKRSGGVLA